MVRNFANGCNILVHKNALPQGRAFCLGQFLARVLPSMPLPCCAEPQAVKTFVRHLCLGGNCRKQTSRHNAAPCGVCGARLGTGSRKARGRENQKESTYEALSFSWTCVLCCGSVFVVVYVVREQNLSVCAAPFIVRLRSRRVITPNGHGVGFGVLKVLKSARRATYPCRKRPSF